MADHPTAVQMENENDLNKEDLENSAEEENVTELEKDIEEEEAAEIISPEEQPVIVEEANKTEDTPETPKAPEEELIQRRFRHLAQSFRERTARVRKRFDLPPTPSTVSSEPEEINTRVSAEEERQLMASMSKEWNPELGGAHSWGIVDPQSCLYVTWLSMVTLSYLYNSFVIPLRVTFPYQSDDNTPLWVALDLSMDLVYLLDLVLVKPRVMFLENGFWVRDIRKTSANYFKKSEFIVDIISLTPLDVLYFYFGANFPHLRVPRLLKIHCFWEFFNHFDKFSPSPYIIRIARTLTYMIYLVHLNACAYYWVSESEGLASNHWVYNGVGNAYIRCFYFAVKTATSIGKNPRPENEAEYVFMTVSWLMGVFVFAILIGQIRDIIATATRSQTEYRKLMDETLHHLRKLNLPQRQIERVKTWFSYTWEQQHTLDESKVLDTLPHKMKTDVAINVHISTLNKVQLFKDCDEALLRELVLKLRPVLYLPGDYICRKGEVGREMYIVKSGQVQVVTGEEGNDVLATLSEGSVFGEISLLQVQGINRRTADVRSNGFSNLFVLNKDDLNEALKFHPNAQEILRKKARQLVKQNAAREMMNKVKGEIQAEILIGNPEPGPKQPKLLPIVMKVLPPESGPARLLKYGSRWGRKRRLNTTNSGASAPQTSLKRRCNSIELGYLGRGLSIVSNSGSENTFQCNVTVHREMT